MHRYVGFSETFLLLRLTAILVYEIPHTVIGVPCNDASQYERRTVVIGVPCDDASQYERRTTLALMLSPLQEFVLSSFDRPKIVVNGNNSVSNLREFLLPDAQTGTNIIKPLCPI
jgi:hypothetical protein